MHLMESKVYLASLQAMLSDLDLSFLNGKQILVAGATGMVGSCLVDALMLWNQSQLKPCKVVAIANSLSHAKERFSYCWTDTNYHFCKQNIAYPGEGFPQKIDYIIHAASNADPVAISTNPVDTLLANVIGTNNLINYGRSHGMKRFLYISSGEFYGQANANITAFEEDYCGSMDYSSPRTSYPAGKRAAEVLCQSAISQYQIDAVIVRPCHLFGPTMRPQDSRAVSEFLWNAVAQKDIVLKSTGQMERSHCYIIDAIKAILLVLRGGKCGQAYNIADPQYQMTIRAFAEKAAAAGACQVTTKEPSSLETRGYSKVSRAVLDSLRLKTLGWSPQKKTISAIEETVMILREICNISNLCSD